MVINLIVAMTDDDVYDICSAWDEWTLDANYGGFKKTLAKFVGKYGDVRVIEVEVPDDMYQKAFAKTRIQGKVRETTSDERRDGK